MNRTSKIDVLLFVSALGLMLFSIGAVYSASISVAGMKHGDAAFLFKNHAFRVAMGVVALFAGMAIDYHVYKKYSKILVIASIVLLTITIFAGVTVNGAQRWISYGPLQFQPSELAKYALILHLAVLLAEKQSYIDNFKNGYVPLLLWVVIVVVMIFIQPNFSTGAVIFVVSLLMLYAGRVKLSYLLGTVAAGIPLVIAYAISAPYRWNRIIAFIQSENSGELTDAAKYQAQQAVIGLGSGGVFGVGMGLSKQRELFLPESYTDFIYAIVGEEYGLVGAVSVLAVFALIMFRGIIISKHANDDLGRYIAVGLTTIIVVYALVNVMVTTGLLPTTGLPMPLISYGGTSIIITSYVFGILLNVSMYGNLRLLTKTSDINK